MESLVIPEDCELVRMPDYIPEECRETYDMLQSLIESRTNAIIDTAKSTMGGRCMEVEFMSALYEMLLSDHYLNQLKKSFAEFSIICCQPRFMIKRKGDI